MPDHGRQATSDSSELPGEIIEVEGGQTRVRLSSGDIGVLPSTGEAGALQPGQRATFRIERRDGSQPPVLSVVRRDDPAPMPAFDQEVDRLHDALANHHPTNCYQQPQQDLIGEDRIQQWVNSVERRLAALRKNRAKRLDEEFYNP
ncbi:hypothetical protein ACFLSF_03850 [Candidatus Bipolaricaulota bacterium]